ncbi:hypothetical protein C8J56DRAFT_298502 [Mycena floridula]|nr:hypothetical protein C8J56DRAFT_298502 [Mycena floridula]
MVISQLKAVVQAQQSEILNLKNELAVQSFSAGKGKGKLSNPLPAPPQPLSLDKYPRFVRDSIGPSPDFTQDPQFTRKILEWEAEWSRRSDFRNVPGPSESLAMAYAEARSQPVDPDSTDPKQRNVIVQGASPNSRVGPTRPLTTPVAPSEPPRRRRERPRESERRPRIYADQPEEPGPSSIRPVETVEFVNGFGQAYTAGYEAASRIGFRPDTSRRHTSDVGSSFTTTSGAMFPDSSSPGLHREPVQIPVVPVAPAPLSSRPRVVSFVDPPQAEAFDRRNPGSRPASDSFGTPRGAPSRGSSASWGTPRSVRTEASEAWFDSLHSFPAPGHPDSTLLASVERHGQTAGTTPRPRSNAPRSATAQPASTTEFGQTPMTNGFTRYQSSQLDPRLESLLADDHRLPSTSSISQTNPTSSTPQYQHPGIPNGQRMPPRRFSIQTDIPIVDDREFYPGPQPNYDPPLRSAPVGRIPRVTSSENNGNALGLNLNSDHLLPGTPTVVAPTPQFSTTPFLRSYSRD